METGLIRLTIEIDTPLANGQPSILSGVLPSLLNIVVGRRDLARGKPESEWPNLVCWLVQRGNQGPPLRRQSRLAKQVRDQVSMMLQGQAPLEGGLLFFPHDRRLALADKGGPIEPLRSSVHGFSATPPVIGGRAASKRWVWQNYLDLERGRPKWHLAGSLCGER